jgi:hypothetical protein
MINIEDFIEGMELADILIEKGEALKRALILKYGQETEIERKEEDHGQQQ